MRLGLIADTHMPGAIVALWPQVFDVFEGVDAILHAGDLHTLAVVEQLESVAPVHVARGNGDEGIQDARVKDCWTLEVEGLKIGMIHRFPSPDRNRDRLDGHTQRVFGTPAPDIIVYGHTHREVLYADHRRLYVNPGSPTLPRNRSPRPGTVALLNIEEHRATATLLQLTAAGSELHEELTLAFPPPCVLSR